MKTIEPKKCVKNEKKREITHIQKMLKVHYATFYGPINKQKD